MLSLFGGWASTTTINLLLSGWHSPLHYSICWEFSHPCFPLQRIFPTSAVKTPVSLSGNHWSVGWSCCSASKFSMLDVRSSRQWSLCRYARDAGYVTSYVLILVSLMTMTAICMDRLLALLLGLRYKQIVTLKRTYIIVTTFWVLLLSPLYVQFFISLQSFCTAA